MSASRVAAALTTIGRYAVALLRYNLILPWYRPNEAKRFLTLALEYDFQRGAGRKLPSAPVLDIFPEARQQEWTVAGQSAADVETLVLCAAVRAVGARRVLEIGTFEGATTVQLAANVTADGHVFTLDLDPAGAADAVIPCVGSDVQLTGKPLERIGRQYRDTPYAARITQILHDSTTVDYRQYFDQLDLAFIDGGHSYEQVKCDTERVLPLVRPGGAVLWHDYRPGCAGVRRYLHELARTRPVRHVRGTCLAALRV